MAVATPVFENGINEEEKTSRVSYATRAVEDDAHNAGISDRFATLINPNSRLEDLLAPRAQVNAGVKAEATAETARPYLVENARADSPLFRADSAINRLPETNAAPISAPSSEEEDEDLRPTSTTIQYRTVEQDRKQTAVKATTDRRSAVLGKKEKIIIAVFVSVVIALLALVIINSAVIANLNADIAAAQEKIVEVKGALAGVNANIVEIINPTNR